MSRIHGSPIRCGRCANAEFVFRCSGSLIFLACFVFGCSESSEVTPQQLHERFDFPVLLENCSRVEVLRFVSDDEHDTFVRASTASPTSVKNAVQAQVRGEFFVSEEVPPVPLERIPAFVSGDRTEFVRVTTGTPYRRGLICNTTDDTIMFWLFRRHSSGLHH